MAKKCWIATLEVEVPIWAETGSEACAIAAREAMRDIDVSPWDFSAAPAAYCPGDYGDGDFVWGADTELTIKAALEQTPEYQAAKAEMARLKQAMNDAGL